MIQQPNNRSQEDVLLGDANELSQPANENEAEESEDEIMEEVKENALDEQEQSSLFE